MAFLKNKDIHLDDPWVTKESSLKSHQKYSSNRKGFNGVGVNKYIVSRIFVNNFDVFDMSLNDHFRCLEKAVLEWF